VAGRRGGRAAPPSSGYQEWAAFLERWSEGGPVDSAHLGPLAVEAFAGDTWRRLTDRFTAALSRRLELWQAALARATAAATDEFEYGRALQQSRAGLRALRGLAGDQRLPEDLRTGLTGIVDGAVAGMQKQLEQSVDRLRGTGDADRRAEARRRTLRANPLTAVTGDTAMERAAASGPDDPFEAPRRRIGRP